MRAFFLFLLFSFFSAAADDVRKPLWDYKFSENLPNWFNQSLFEVADDLSEANAEGKRLMLYFGQDYCGACKRFHAVVLEQKDIVERMQQGLSVLAFNMVGSDTWKWLDNKNYTEKELANKLQIIATPSFLFLNEEGTFIARVTGYVEPERYRKLLDYVLEKKEQDKPFKRYWKEVNLAFQKGQG